MADDTAVFPIRMYLLIPENFHDLAARTELKREELQYMYDYDQSYGLVSKIYLVKEKK